MNFFHHRGNSFALLDRLLHSPHGIYFILWLPKRNDGAYLLWGWSVVYTRCSWVNRSSTSPYLPAVWSLGDLGARPNVRPPLHIFNSLRSPPVRSLVVPCDHFPASAHHTRNETVWIGGLAQGRGSGLARSKEGTHIFPATLTPGLDLTVSVAWHPRFETTAPVY